MVILHKVDPFKCKYKISGLNIALIIVLNVVINLIFSPPREFFDILAECTAK